MVKECCEGDVAVDNAVKNTSAVSFWPSAEKRDFDREVEVFIDFLDFMAFSISFVIVLLLSDL